MSKIKIKSPEEIKIMAEGGKKLAKIRQELMKNVKEGVSAMDIEELANDLIEKSGGKASFKMVPGYSWATCINVNDGVVHGIPKKEVVFKNGDNVSVDVGLYYKGFHTDTSDSILIGSDTKKEKFLRVGREALNRAIKNAKVGNSVFDISEAMEDSLDASGYTPIEVLTGHGIGKELHEEPFIPCFVPFKGNKRVNSPRLEKGIVLAVEIMYTMGDHKVRTDKDGWTIRTKDGTIAALFEETIVVDNNGPIVLTKL